MSSPVRRRITPSVPFTLRVENQDGSSFELSLRLAFDFNALALVEEETGINALNGEAFQKQNATVLSALLWAALQKHHPEYAGREGLEVVRTWLDLGNVTAVLDALTEAFLATMPKEKADILRKNIKTEKEGSDPLGESK